MSLLAAAAVALLAAAPAAPATSATSTGSTALACEPSRACAIEMARAAGRQSYRIRKDNHEYVTALLVIADAQRKAGDTAGFAATVKETRAAIDGYQGGRDEVGYRSSLAMIQAQAGLLDDALATAKSVRGAKQRGDAYASVAGALAGQGRWREAMAVAKKAPRHKDSRPPELDITRVLIASGRRDWVLEFVRAEAPEEEAYMLASVELAAGHYAAARSEVARMSDVNRRLTLLEQIAQEIETRVLAADHPASMESELAATARLIPPEADKGDPELRSIHYELAAKWLINARAFDDALALLPRLSSGRSTLLIDVAYHQALTGDYHKSVKLLDSIDPAGRQRVLPAIAVGKVLAGDETIEQAMAPIRVSHQRFTALELMGSMLPAPRQGEAGSALRQAREIALRTETTERDGTLRELAFAQARRGLFEDALDTAAQIHDALELLAAYGEIANGQAAKGQLDAARKTFALAETQARKIRFNAEDHAFLTGSLGKSGLLPETFAQIQALCRRDPSERWVDEDLDPAIQAHLKAGQVSRAFEAAALLSDHESGNPHYFLILAAELKP